MQPLIPQVRVNKNGIPVTKHVRADRPSLSSRILSRVMPVINPSYRTIEETRRADILGFLKTQMEEDEAAKDRAVESQIQQETDPLMQRQMQMSAHRSRYLYEEGKIERSLEKLKPYSLDTLERLMEASDGSVTATSLLKSASSDNEADFRAYLSFHNLDFPSGHIALVLSNVRESTGVDELAEIEPGSEAHDLVSAVISVANKSHRRRSKDHYDREREKGRPYRRMVSFSRDWYQQERELTKMTRELAGVIIDHPDRVDDIVDYMSDRELNPADVDGGHLRAHLDNAASSLSSGVL